MPKPPPPLDRTKQRLKSLYLFLILVLGGLVITLFYMQVWQNDAFLLRSTKNFLRHESITSLRGAIFDCHGIPLATNRPVNTIIWKGSGNKKWSEQQKFILQKIESITQTQLLDNKELLACEKTGRSYVLIPDIPFDQLSKILEQTPVNNNVTLNTHYARFYPHNNLACHVLGYFRMQTHDSPTGLEKLLEKELCGSPGVLEKTINSVGKPLQLREIEKALNGKNIYTTIDFELQKIAEKVFPQGEAGTFIVMDPHNGALRVCMSRPDFDPNIFLKPLSAEEWKKLKEEKPFIHRCMFAEYPPASLFKIVSVTAGIEEGIITTDQSWFCGGYVDFGDRQFRCHRFETGGHGRVKNMEEAMAYSCNIPFYEIGKRISIDTLAAYAKKYGLGEPTAVVLPEKRGLIPTAAWKQKTYGEPWWQGETLNCSIGQGPFLVTPLQVARAFSGIFTGILVRPRILEHESIDIQPLKISSHTLKFLRQSLRMTITMGTGSIMNKLKNMTIHAKTGTAQTSHRSRREEGKQFLEHAWFVSFAQYKEYEPIVLVILIENAGSARFATRVAKQFFIEYCALMDQRATNPHSSSAA